MLTKKFKFHSDPGHGWLAVRVLDLLKVGLDLTDISGYSYVNGQTVYLEEDCDLTKFWNAFEFTFGSVPTIVNLEQRNSYHNIRSYPQLSTIRNQG